MRRRTLFTAGAAAAVAGTAAVSTLPAWAQSDDEAGASQTWSSSDQWGMWESGEYTFYNNIWGSGAGTQTIWANTIDDWGVTADHPNTGGIKSYPNVSYTLGLPVMEMGDVSATLAVDVPAEGEGVAYNSAFDVWGDGHAHEIMIWTQWTSNVGPIGGQVDTVELGGHTWDYYQGSNGANEVYSFLAQEQFTQGTVGLTEIAQWLVAQGHMPEVQIDQIQFGWEITSAAGGHDFTVTDYSLTV
ncbi:GH12 family glycosyl hydrolase domain-containing protein [Glycomyces buryatensis]|uniref:Glycosyl hydrolase family 12 n=1 Tax=Glycomyces buryatensis TaxID=2570927 RepID=A0A4S8Q2L5_9ACTN|nr:hypothetical protein [Glycomyces buryatensis]THV38427.1 hypothetical protein FAB82_18425 [Glycomyces buryatensis]